MVEEFDEKTDVLLLRKHRAQFAEHNRSSEAFSKGAEAHEAGQGYDVLIFLIWILWPGRGVGL